jgi:hypothetical protein
MAGDERISTHTNSLQNFSSGVEMDEPYDEPHLLSGETNILNLDEELIDEVNQDDDVAVDDADLLGAPDHIPDGDSEDEDGDEDVEVGLYT